MNYPHPYIAKEGWPFIAIAFVVSIFATVFLPDFIAFLFWLGLFFVIQFFRDPPRAIPKEENAVLSPADGRIVKVEIVTDSYTDGRKALLISVFMNVFNVHSNRVSVDGKVQKVEYFPGSFVNADLDKASSQNERNAVVIETPKGQIVTLVQVAGLVARRILCYVKPGATLEKGERYGFIRFGSRVDVYLPVDANPCVAPGDKVLATSTVLATFDQEERYESTVVQEGVIPKFTYK